MEEALADRITSLLEQIRQKINSIADTINSTLESLPDAMAWIVDEVQAGWQRMLEKLDELWEWFTDKLSYVGNPSMLAEAATSWVANVGAPVVRVNETLADASLSVDDEWEGRAARQYQQGVQPQRDANDSILSDFAQNLSDALTEMAEAITAFWVAVAGGLPVLLVGLLGASGLAGTIVGLPAATVVIVGEIVVYLGVVGTQARLLNSKAGTAKASLVSATAGISAWPKLSI